MVELSRRKQAWVDKRKPEMLRAGTINPSAAIEGRYYSALAKLIDEMTTTTEKELKKLFDTAHAEEYFAEDATISAQSRILTNELMDRFNLLFSRKAGPISKQFVKVSNQASKSSIDINLKELSGGLTLKSAGTDPHLREIISATTTENVQLIKSIAQKYLAGVQGAVMRSVAGGGGLQTLIPYLEKQKGITYRRARFIALDQTRKAMNNLSAARMEDMGLEEFEWLHTGGSDHPRPLHVSMSGKIYSLKNPPVINEKTGARGLPGHEPRCRCRMKMVLRLEKLGAR